MSNAPTRWRPGTLSKPKAHADHASWETVDLAMRNIYDTHYATSQVFNLTQDNTQPSGVSVQAVLGTGNGQKIAAGSATVTGNKKTIATGLATVTAVVVSINASAGVFEIVTAQPTPSALSRSSIDIYVWKATANNNVTPIASTTARLVEWIAFGT